MPSKCCIVGCSKRAERDNIKFYRMPKIQKNKLHDLSKRRQEAWLKVINRKDLKNNNLLYTHVCANHFISGRSAAINDELNPDWVPSLNLGYNIPLKKKPVSRYQRGKKRSLPSLEPNKEFEPSIMEPLITIKAEPEVRNEPISDAISYIKNEKSEYMTEFQTVYPDYLDVQNEMLNDPITIVKEEPSEYISEFETSAPDHLSMQFEIINDPMSIVKEEPSEMIINEYFSPSSNDRTMPREDDQSKADNIVPTKIICDDDHMLFLRSLMPFFKKLDTTQTLRLRNKFKELLIQEINSNNLQNG